MAESHPPPTSPYGGAPLNAAALYWQSVPPVTGPARHWLTDRGSLTRKLVAQSGGAFAVRVQHEGVSFCSPGPGLLPLKHGLYWQREVILLGRGEPWVRALTLVPARNQLLRARLRLLGTRPLGGFLFSRHDLRRERMDYAISADGVARRTHFTIGQQPIVLIELLLQPFLDQIVNEP